MAESTGIVVVGTGEVGEVRRAPRVAVVRVGVSATRASVRDATDVAAQRAQAVIDALRANGVGHQDITTSRLSLTPHHEHGRSGTPRRTGFSMSNVVIATVRDIARTGEVIDAAVDAGGDEAVVEGVTFTDDDGDGRDDAALAAEAQARAAAYADARAKAEHLAGLAGVSLGALVEIQELGRPGQPREVGEMRMMAARDVNTPIAPGQLSTVATLLVRFAIL